MLMDSAGGLLSFSSKSFVRVNIDDQFSNTLHGTEDMDANQKSDKFMEIAERASMKTSKLCANN